MLSNITLHFVLCYYVLLLLLFFPPIVSSSFDVSIFLNDFRYLCFESKDELNVPIGSVTTGFYLHHLFQVAGAPQSRLKLLLLFFILYARYA